MSKNIKEIDVDAVVQEAIEEFVKLASTVDFEHLLAGIRVVASLVETILVGDVNALRFLGHGRCSITGGNGAYFCETRPTHCAALTPNACITVSLSQPAQRWL